MVLAWLLTVLALGGIGVGARWGHAVRISDHLSAAGGGLLFGISLFWLVPEIAETTGQPGGFLLTAGVAGLLALLDRMLTHGRETGHSKHPHADFLWPLLAATAVHSLLDGWSIRLLSGAAVANAAVAVGLALHKIPEGLALGWISRRALGSIPRAVVAGSAAEVFTLLGAFAEPNLNASGSAHFGFWWAACVLALIAGGFLFLGMHAVLPAWKSGNRKVLATFLATLLVVGALTLLRPANI